MNKRYIAGKILEACGIAALLLGLVQGMEFNDMYTDLYFFIAGMAVFFVGWMLEKKARK